jgi:hypothetical protein
VTSDQKSAVPLARSVLPVSRKLRVRLGTARQRVAWQGLAWLGMARALLNGQCK